MSEERPYIIHVVDRYHHSIGGPFRSINHIIDVCSVVSTHFVVCRSEERADGDCGLKDCVDLFRFSWSLVSLLFRHRGSPNLIIHFHGGWHPSQIIGPIVGKLLGFKIIFSTRGICSRVALNSSRKKQLVWPLHRLALKNSVIVCSSAAELSDVQRAMSSGWLGWAVEPEKLTVIPNKSIRNYSVARLEKGLLSPSPCGFSIGFLGRIHQFKRIDLLVKAVNSLPFEANLFCVGPIEDVIYHRVLVDLDTLGRVKFFGCLAPSTLGNFWSSIDCLALVSRDENFGNSIFEALEIGVPCLVTSNLWWSKSSFSMFVADSTVDSIASQICTIKSTKPVLIDSKRRINQRILKTEFSEIALREKWLSLYTDET